MKITFLLLILLASLHQVQAQYVYTNTDNAAVKACFKNFCDTDTISLKSIKKIRSLTLLTNDESLKIAEFTIMLTDINEEVYVAKIKWDYLDRNNLDLLSRNYKTIQLTDILAKAKDGHLVKLKPKLYYIIP